MRSPLTVIKTMVWWPIKNVWRGLVRLIEYDIKPTLTSDFVPHLALTRSLCSQYYPTIKPYVTLGRTHHLYPKLFHEFEARLYRRGDRIFVGRGYPLSSVQDIIAMVDKCGIRNDRALKEALAQWNALKSTGCHDSVVDVIDEARFDDFIKTDALPMIERELRDPIPPPPDLDERHF